AAPAAGAAGGAGRGDDRLGPGPGPRALPGGRLRPPPDQARRPGPAPPPAGPAARPGRRAAGLTARPVWAARSASRLPSPPGLGTSFASIPSCATEELYFPDGGPLA